MRTEPELEVADALAAGHEALSRGEWEQALAYFETASEHRQSAEAMEALAMAAWWLDNARLAIESRENAYRLYRERGDAAAAARMAIWLGWDSLAFSRPASCCARLAATGRPLARGTRPGARTRLARTSRRGVCLSLRE
jgi:tetratricopeptide (TPR) repeat protein